MPLRQIELLEPCEVLLRDEKISRALGAFEIDVFDRAILDIRLLPRPRGLAVELRERRAGGGEEEDRRAGRKDGGEPLAEMLRDVIGARGRGLQPRLSRPKVVEQAAVVRNAQTPRV